MKNPVAQSAGDCSVKVYTDGHPLYATIEIDTRSGQGTKSAHVEIAYLHDLRYCIDRVLEQLAHAGVKD